MVLDLSEENVSGLMMGPADLSRHEWVSGKWDEDRLCCLLLVSKEIRAGTRSL